MIFLDVLYCFPIVLPATAQSMSYVSVVSAGLVSFVAALWFTTKRKVFKGPKVDYRLMEERRLAAVRIDIVGVDVVSMTNAETTQVDTKL